MPRATSESRLVRALGLGLVAALLACSARPALARTADKKAPFESKKTLFSPPGGVDEPLSDVVLPMFSLGFPVGPVLLGFPGLAQWWHGQYASAAAYTGIGLAGLGYGLHVARSSRLYERMEEAEKEQGSDDRPPIDPKDLDFRKATLGFQVMQASGGFSAYHAFRTAVRTRRPRGQYGFLTREESITDILTAPFDVSYVQRTTTMIPLAIGGFVLLSSFSAVPDGYERDLFTGTDAVFAGAFSFNAGTYEEAWFRGWMMPVFHEYTGNEWLANGLTSLIFAAAHLNSNPNPWPQLLLGLHFGYVTMKDAWTLGEAIFIHTWWDVMIFTAQYQYKLKAEKEGDQEAAARITPVLWLPPLALTF